jgi:hypothetical protein
VSSIVGPKCAAHEQDSTFRHRFGNRRIMCSVVLVLFHLVHRPRPRSRFCARSEPVRSLVHDALCGLGSRVFRGSMVRFLEISPSIATAAFRFSAAGHRAFHLGAAAGCIDAGRETGTFVEEERDMKEWSNKPDAENPARASRLAIGYHWRGVSDPFRSATSIT